MKYDLKVYRDAEELSPEALAVAEILSQPGRGGMTLDQIGDLAGVSARTVSRWQRDPLVMEYVRRRSLENVTAAMPDVMEQIISQAAAGRSVRALELYARIAGLYTPELLVRAEQPEQSNAEIEQHIEKLQKQLEEIGRYENVES